ncbi:hypothetical protein [Candidatus Poriferisodalis sp.]
MVDVLVPALLAGKWVVRATLDLLGVGRGGAGAERDRREHCGDERNGRER